MIAQFKTCFVIQCFDDGTYDKRYRETFAPAIERGGAKPVRADEVLGTHPVVEKIEQGLRNADVAFAEISEDNPNVFLELGYALALHVPTIIVCDKGRRSRLPFDIAHRPVNFYVTDAQSDYERISNEIEKGVAAALTEDRLTYTFIGNPEDASSVDEVKSGCLTQLVEQSLISPAGASLWQLEKDLAQFGFSSRMISLAIAGLISDGLVRKHELTDPNNEPYHSFSLSERGQKHLLRSYSSLMDAERALKRQNASWGSPKMLALDDEIPF